MDTLTQTQKLKEAGFNQIQSEVLVKTWTGYINDNFATVEDFKQLETKMIYMFEKNELKLTIRMAIISFTIMSIGISIQTWILKHYILVNL
ncbi:MAG: hypothetical protein CME70_14395 [Halobacteriovorax sp.]|nr:hypothetical protein [Halobacteriovorax sp.]